MTMKDFISAPRYILGVDYKASYKPSTIDLLAVDAANDVYEAMKAGYEHWNDEQVWCLSLYERSTETEGGYIEYKERLITYNGVDWRLAIWGNSVWYGVAEQKPMWRADRNL